MIFKHIKHVNSAGEQRFRTHINAEYSSPFCVFSLVNCKLIYTVPWSRIGVGCGFRVVWLPF